MNITREWRQLCSALAGAPALILALAGGEACHSEPAIRELTVTGVDYAFQLPDSIQPGRTILRFRNAGKVRHEMVIAQLKNGVTLARVLEVVKTGGSPDSLLDGIVGILIAPPGALTIGGLLADFLPGRTYAFVCSFQDSPDKPPHLALGMIAGRQVRASK